MKKSKFGGVPVTTHTKSRGPGKGKAFTANEGSLPEGGTEKEIVRRQGWKPTQTGGPGDE